MLQGGPYLDTRLLKNLSPLKDNDFIRIAKIG